jgi:hypothetical protein
MEKPFGQPSVSQGDLFSTPPVLPTPEIVQRELDLDATTTDSTSQSLAPEPTLTKSALTSYEMPAESYVIEAVKKLGLVINRDVCIAGAKTPGSRFWHGLVNQYGDNLDPHVARWESDRALFGKDSFYAFARALIRDNLILSDTDPESRTHVIGTDSDIDTAYKEFASWCFEDDGAAKRRSRLIRKMEKSIAAKQKERRTIS